MVRIWRYVADDNEAAANRLLERFADVARTLSAHPDAGRARPELSEGLRSFVVGNYILFYKATQSELLVVRFLSRYLDIDADDFDPV